MDEEIKMKKIIALTLYALMLVAALAGCGGTASTDANEYTVGICQLIFCDGLLNVQGNTQREMIICNILNSGNLCKAFLAFVCLIRLCNTLDVFIFQETLCVLTFNLIDCIDKQNLTTPIRAFVHATDHNAGFHGRIVEQIRSQADHTFYSITSDQLFSHSTFLVAE